MVKDGYMTYHFALRKSADGKSEKRKGEGQGEGICEIPRANQTALCFVTLLDPHFTQPLSYWRDDFRFRMIQLNLRSTPWNARTSYKLEVGGISQASIFLACSNRRPSFVFDSKD